MSKQSKRTISSPATLAEPQKPLHQNEKRELQAVPHDNNKKEIN